MATRNHPEPTEEQLAMAFRQLRRPHWPATLEEAMRVPIHERCIRLIASQLGRTPWGRRPPLTGQAEAPPAQAPHPRLPMRRDYFDARKAAANDLDDDE